MAPPRFQLEAVRVRFAGHTALDGVSLRVERGERLAVIGPSGAGKTTLLRLLIGAVRPESGRVEVDGRDLARLRPAELRALRAETGFVHQDHRLVPTQRVLSNVLCGRLGRWGLARALRELAWPRRSEVERVYRLLARVGVPEKLYTRVESLSGGQQQRVAIARALYQDPSVLVADEPLAGVDPARARDTLALLCTLAAEEGLTFCASLHHLELAREHFPRLVGMRDGRVFFDAASGEVGEEQVAALYRLGGEARAAP